MRKEEYLEKLLAAHEAYFDVTRHYAFAGQTFEGYAEYHSESSQYVLAKRAKLWGANTHEYAFFKLVDHLDIEKAHELVELVTTRGLEKVELNPEHMTSYLTLIIIADTADDDAIKFMQRAKYRKSFKFGLRGWADLRCALALISDCRIMANVRADDLKATLEKQMTEG